ncbi:MAG: flagellar biosynthetic protein FliR [Rhodospirillales bacterium]|nr:flagellar biosynthetic protein FliR [Rhodospirillales bacterium]MDE2574734.1 flagellar biosynthetic protein FliR [Rhodospirillales bacterium]
MAAVPIAADDAAFLASLPGWAFAAALLIARIGSAAMLLPGIGEMEVPPTIRAGFTLAMVAVVLPVVLPLVPPAPSDAWRAAAMVGAEIATGLWLGWLTRLLLLALPVAGQMIASLIGLANVIQPDPALGPQTAVVSRALGLAAPVMILASGLHALPLAALAGSYRLVPPGALLPAVDTAQLAVRAVAHSFAFALQLAAPFVLAGLVWQAGLAVLARLVPQLQIYFAAMPGLIIGGTALLALLAAALLGTWQAGVREGFLALPGL